MLSGKPEATSTFSERVFFSKMTVNKQLRGTNGIL